MSAEIENERVEKKRVEGLAANKDFLENVQLHAKMNKDPKFKNKIEENTETKK
jgi:hypothetical protein